MASGTRFSKSSSISTLTLIPLLTLLLLVSGCASHGNWSRSDRGAWANLDEQIGSHERSYYVKKWGEPISIQDVHVDDGSGVVRIQGKELLWLWKPDGTGQSDQPGQGWELFLLFDKQESFDNWRIGGYRSTLTVPDVMTASRRFEYRFGKEMLLALGLLNEQHGIASSPSASWGTWELDRAKAEYGIPPKWRGWTINKFQEAVRVIAEATFRADNAARNLHARLATDEEVFAWLNEAAERNRMSSRHHQSGARGISDPTVQDRIQSGGLLGSGFLDSYAPNAYGPGVNADATGRPFIWQPDPGFGAADPFSTVKPNAYGLGVGMDQYGRPVRPACPPGWAGPC